MSKRPLLIAAAIQIIIGIFAAQTTPPIFALTYTAALVFQQWRMHLLAALYFKAETAHEIAHTLRETTIDILNASLLSATRTLQTHDPKNAAAILTETATAIVALSTTPAAAPPAPHPNQRGTHF